MGVVLYNKGYQMKKKTIHSTGVDTIIDTRFEFINFYEDQKEVGVRTSIYFT